LFHALLSSLEHHFEIFNVFLKSLELQPHQSPVFILVVGDFDAHKSLDYYIEQITLLTILEDLRVSSKLKELESQTQLYHVFVTNVFALEELDLTNKLHHLSKLLVGSLGGRFFKDKLHPLSSYLAFTIKKVFEQKGVPVSCCSLRGDGFSYVFLLFCVRMDRTVLRWTSVTGFRPGIDIHTLL
jgi:hypothetical protein